MSAEYHIGREWTTHKIEDACPCPKVACGLVAQSVTDPTCEHHPIERAKSLRQGHRMHECPATPTAIARDVQKASEDLYAELDTIAQKYGMNSREMTAVIANEIGSQPGYDEWMQETWEPLEETA